MALIISANCYASRDVSVCSMAIALFTITKVVIRLPKASEMVHAENTRWRAEETPDMSDTTTKMLSGTRNRAESYIRRKISVQKGSQREGLDAPTCSGAAITYSNFLHRFGPLTPHFVG